MPKLYKLEVGDKLSQKVFTKSQAKEVIKKYETKKVKAEMVLVCDNAVVHSLEGNGDIAFFQCLTWNTENFFSSDRINRQER